jgi:AraC-like DNA-binding protein
MGMNNLVFYIHYCGSRQPDEPWKYKTKISRILEHHELIFITGGSGSITIGDKRYQAEEGMIFYICSDIFQSIESDINNPLYFISVHFSYANVMLSDKRWNIKNGNNILPLNPMETVKDYYNTSYIFRKLISSWNEKLPGYELITTALLQQLIFELYSHKKKESRNYSVSLKIENIIKYMHENINNKLTLNELAERVQLSPTYLSKVFKDNTGYSLIGFFNRIKIDKAKELIIEGNKKIKEVAHEVGFTDEFYFSRIFKKIEGISPAEFYSKNVHGV